MLKRTNAGFTLVELMVVVAIVGTLATVAIPTYQSYSVRAKMAEVVLALSGCRTTISEVYASGTLPGANQWGCETTASSARYVREISTNEDGVVTAVADGFNNPAIDGRTILLVPYKDLSTPITAADAGQRVARWVCAPGEQGIPANFLPAACRDRAS
jgi:type IV pilus assembly protein PilA